MLTLLITEHKKLSLDRKLASDLDVEEGDIFLLQPQSSLTAKFAVSNNVYVKTAEEVKANSVFSCVSAAAANSVQQTCVLVFL